MTRGPQCSVGPASHGSLHGGRRQLRPESSATRSWTALHRPLLQFMPDGPTRQLCGSRYTADVIRCAIFFFFCPKWRKSSRARVDGRAGHRARACGAASRRIPAVLSGGGGCTPWLFCSLASRLDLQGKKRDAWTTKEALSTRAGRCFSAVAFPSTAHGFPLEFGFCSCTVARCPPLRDSAKNMF
jgi:hypothetical protein